VNGGYVLADYGHNTAAIKAISGMVSEWPVESTTTVLGLPGDRDGKIIREAACAAGQAFDRVIVREDNDLRGRRPGEMANLLAQTIRAECPDTGLVTILEETEAVQTALDDMKTGELVVIFCDDCGLVRQAVESRGGVPAWRIEPAEEEQVRVA
jgi:cyanophycin synthetase